MISGPKGFGPWEVSEMSSRYSTDDLYRAYTQLLRESQEMRETIRVLTSICEQNARAIQTLSFRMDFNGLKTE